MNTLDDLRSTLRHEADGVEDPARYARPVAVRERIRVARRRRTALAACAAVVVLVGGIAAAGTVLDRWQRVEPATQVAGIDVPEHVTVYGFPYALDDTTAFSGDRDHLQVSPTDHWQAVSLVASGLGDGFATLFLDGEPVARAEGAGAVEMPVPFFDGSPTLRVRLDGAPAGARTGIAVYAATGDLPSGVTNGTAVFREEVAGGHLVAGAFSETGSSSVRVPFNGEPARTRVAYYCRTEEKGLWLNIATDDDGPLRTSCSSGENVDAGVGGSTTGSSGGGAGVEGRHVLRAFLTRGSDGLRVFAPDAVFGVAAYDEPAPQEVLGMPVEQTVELDGRLWALDRVVPQTETGGPVAATVDASEEDRVVGQVAAGATTWITWRGGLLDGESTRIGSAPDVDSAGMVVDGFLPRGDRYRVTLHGRGEAPFRGALLVYRPV